jgi:hypothetical protein
MRLSGSLSRAEKPIDFNGRARTRHGSSRLAGTHQRVRANRWRADSNLAGLRWYRHIGRRAFSRQATAEDGSLCPTCGPGREANGTLAAVISERHAIAQGDSGAAAVEHADEPTRRAAGRIVPFPVVTTLTITEVLPASRRHPAIASGIWQCRSRT